jgi:hypothetical protein
MGATAGVLDIPAMTFALKEYYNGQAVPHLAYDTHPFLGQVSKEEDWQGKYIPLPLIYADSAGRSSNFGFAQLGGAAFGPIVAANANNPASLAGVEWQLTRVQNYSIAWLDRQTMEASRSSVGAFVKAASTYIDSAVQSLARNLSSDLFRDGSGALLQTDASGIAAGTFTVTCQNVDDIVQIEVNQMLSMGTTATGALAGSSATVPVFVKSVNRDAGTFVISGTVGGAAGVGSSGLSTATQYFVFPFGDAAAGGSSKKLSGLAAWIPSATPTSTLFFGVDRSVDTTRLGGVRFNGSAQPIEEALIDMSIRLHREGGKPSAGYLSLASFGALDKALMGKVQYVDVESAGIGFRGIQLMGPTGPIKLFPDIDCPTKTVYMLTLSDWVLGSLGKAPEIQEDWTSGSILRVPFADQGEVRVSYYAQLGCRAPGHSGVGSLGA